MQRVAEGLPEVVVNARHLTGPRTGIEIYMERLLAALGRCGRVAVTALTWAPLGLDLRGVREVVSVRRPDLAPGSPQATLWKLWFDQWCGLRAARPAHGIVFHGMDGFLPVSLRRRDRAVVTVHDLGWQAHPGLYAPRVRLMYQALWPWARRRADRFIAVSRYTADDLMRRAGVPGSKIDVIHHGLDPDFTAAGNGHPPPAEPYFLAVGGVSPRKNTRRLMEAFTRWRARGGHRSRYRLLVTGVSLDPEFAGGNGALPPGVSLVGYVDKAELARLYRGAEAFVYPGIYEGFGLPILEAMACGAPVVASRTGAAPEVAGGAALLVDPFDVSAIEAGLERVTAPGERDRLRGLGRERACGFDWDAAAAATSEVYRRLAG